MKKREDNKRKNSLIKGSVAAVFWIGVWFLAASLINRELIFPSPVVVIRRLGELAVTGSFWMKTGISLVRVLGGFLTGCVAGVLFAVVSAASSWAEAIISPFVRMIRSTPVTSFIILVMLWISYDFVPVFIAGLMVSPVMFMNVREGIQETDKGLLEVGRMYSFDRKKLIKYIYVPSVKPYFVSGAVTSLGLAWKAGIAAEVLCQPSKAIGREMYYSKYYLDSPDLFAWTVVVVIFSIVFEKLLSRIMLSAKQKKETYKFGSRMTVEEEQDYQKEQETGNASESTKVELCKTTISDIAAEKKADLQRAENGEGKNDECKDRPALRIRHLTVGYGDKMVLNDFSIDIPKGITCIMGNSGKGKTTLLHTIAGLLEPKEGEIEGDRERCSLMFQDDRLFPWLSAIENITVVNNDPEAAMKLLKAVELENSADKLPGELSGGMRRRVALARALSYEADLLILDEPFKGLDAALTGRVAKLILDKAIPVLVSTHAVSDIGLLGASRLELQ